MRRALRGGWLADALLSCIIAIPYGIRLLGLDVILPTHTAWIHGDPAMYYIAWAMFRLSAGIHWPITYTAALGYPIGSSIALADPVSLAALLLRPFSSLLPASFQYLGLYSVLCLILQLWFGVRLVRRLAPQRPLLAWAGGLFFLIAPPFTYRFGGHFALTGQWLILAALLLYCRAISDEFSLRRFTLQCVLLTGVALGVNPYLAFMVLGVLAASCVAAALTHRVAPVMTIGMFAAVLLAFAAFSFAFGLSGGGQQDLTAQGYRYLSMNLLAPINPDQAPSPILPRLPSFAGQYEGYNYLGAGTLALLVAIGIALIVRRVRIGRRDLVAWGPLAICGACFTLLALTTLVTVGRTVLIDLDPGQRLTPWLSVLRSSGRLFWVPYYALTLLAIVWTIRHLKPRYGMFVLIAALALQMFDTRSLRANVRISPSAPSVPVRLASPGWSDLGREHRHLAIEPPWQCRGDTPGRMDGYRIFGLLAAEDGLTINSYYAGRYLQDGLTYHCHTAIDQLLRDGLAADTAYVLSPEIATALAKGALGSGHCYSVDGFVLCTRKELHGVREWDPAEGDPGIPPAPVMERPLTERDSGLLPSGWTDLETGFGAWASSTQAAIAYRLPERPARSLRITFMALAGKYPVHFSVIYEGGRMDSVIPAASPPAIRLFTVRLPLGSGQTVHRVMVVTDQLRSPAEQGYNEDTRKMGLGIHSIVADDCAPSPAPDPTNAACAR